MFKAAIASIVALFLVVQTTSAQVSTPAPTQDAPVQVVNPPNLPNVTFYTMLTPGQTESGMDCAVVQQFASQQCQSHEYPDVAVFADDNNQIMIAAYYVFPYETVDSLTNAWGDPLGECQAGDNLVTIWAGERSAISSAGDKTGVVHLIWIGQQPCSLTNQ